MRLNLDPSAGSPPDPVDLPRRPVLDDFLVVDWAAPLPAICHPGGPDMRAARAASENRIRLGGVFPDDVMVVPAGGYQRRSNDIDFRSDRIRPTSG